VVVEGVVVVISVEFAGGGRRRCCCGGGGCRRRCRRRRRDELGYCGVGVVAKTVVVEVGVGVVMSVE